MADWPFPPPSPETTEALLSGLSGAIAGSFLRRTGSRGAWCIGVFIGLVVSLTMGRAVLKGLQGTPLAWLADPLFVHGILGLCGVPIALRLRRIAGRVKVGDLPTIDEEAA